MYTLGDHNEALARISCAGMQRWLHLTRRENVLLIRDGRDGRVVAVVSLTDAGAIRVDTTPGMCPPDAGSVPPQPGSE